MEQVVIEYKVISGTQGCYTTEILENRLNELAKQGYLMHMELKNGWLVLSKWLGPDHDNIQVPSD